VRRPEERVYLQSDKTWKDWKILRCFACKAEMNRDVLACLSMLYLVRCRASGKQRPARYMPSSATVLKLEIIERNELIETFGESVEDIETGMENVLMEDAEDKGSKDVEIREGMDLE
jgi:hypothetical protein